jgi:hypothetical protein
MKIIYLLLFFPIIAFAQYPEDDAETKTPVKQTTETNFTLEDGVIFWQKVFKGNSDNVQHPKLINNKAENCNTGKCKSASMFLFEDFSFNYKIENKENRFRVTIQNIRFNNSVQLDLGGVVTDVKSNSLGDFVIRSKDGKLRKNKAVQKALECLNNYFIEIFTPKPPKKDDW